MSLHSIRQDSGSVRRITGQAVGTAFYELNLCRTGDPGEFLAFETYI